MKARRNITGQIVHFTRGVGKVTVQVDGTEKVMPIGSFLRNYTIIESTQS